VGSKGLPPFANPIQELAFHFIGKPCYISDTMTRDIPQQYQEYAMQDDEIDLIELFKTIMAGWKIWVSTTIVALISAFVYNVYAPPLYEASMSFFIPASSAGNSALRSYAALLGSSTPSNIEDQLLAIAESQRIKLTVTEKITQQYPAPFKAFEAKYEEKQKKKLDPALRIRTFSDSVLKLQKTFQASKSKTGLFELKYEYTDPALAKSVIEAYLATLSDIYQELELSSEREIIKVLDEPQVSSQPVKPKKALNLALAIVAGGGLGVLIVLVKMGFANKKEKDGDTTPAIAQQR
jgi:uncharacterized protein involved in exopolysaccharide biosynthesis